MSKTEGLITSRRNDRLVVAVFLAATCSLAVGTTDARAECPVRAGYVALFSDAGFKGTCVTLSIGDYASHTQIPLPNDAVSSVRVARDVQLYACSDEYFGGVCQLINQDVPDMTRSRVGNDAISSLKVMFRGHSASCVPAQGQAAFFSNRNYNGPCVVKNRGAFPSSMAIGLANDSISSIRVGNKTQTVICSGENYSEDCDLVTANVSDLAKQHGRVKNDSISSAKVQALGEQDCRPSTQQVAIFEDDGFLGPCAVLDIGDYRNSAQFRLRNDSISSILVGSNAQIEICTDDDFATDCERITRSSGHLSGRVQSDSVSSLRVQPLGAHDCAPTATQIAIYENDDFVGPCAVLGPGDYSSLTTAAPGLRKDSASSVEVGAAVNAVICVDDSYHNDCERVRTTAHLADTRIGDNRTSSVRVVSFDEVDCPSADNNVAVFEHASFLAPCRILAFGTYPVLSSFEPGALSQATVSSVRIGAAVQLCACSNENMSGACRTLDASVGDLRTIYLNDTFASMRVDKLGAQCVSTISQSQGYKAMAVQNCASTEHQLSIWLEEPGMAPVRVGIAPSQYSKDGSGWCPAGADYIFPLKAGHTVRPVAVDQQATLCGKDDPTIISCRTFVGARFVTGDPNGGTIPWDIH